MSTALKDPEKRISHKEEFELCYLRHKYLRRIEYYPTREEMAPYNDIVENFSRDTFFICKNLFILVGLDLVDIINTSQVYLMTYLGLFALERNEKKLKDFKRLFRRNRSVKCTPNDILDKNKANFTCFIKQRLEDLVRVCRQKSKNIKGLPSEDYVVFTGKKCPPYDIEDLLDNYKQYDFKPFSISAFKTIKSQFENSQDGPVYLKNKVWYVCVPLKKKSLVLDDFTRQDLNPYDNLHNMTPDQIFEEKEDNDLYKINYNKFNTLPKKERARIIKLFVTENKKNPKFKEELSAAQKLLESLNVRNV